MKKVAIEYFDVVPFLKTENKERDKNKEAKESKKKDKREERKEQERDRAREIEKGGG